MENTLSIVNGVLAVINFFMLLHGLFFASNYNMYAAFINFTAAMFCTVTAVLNWEGKE